MYDVKSQGGNQAAIWKHIQLYGTMQSPAVNMHIIFNTALVKNALTLECISGLFSYNIFVIKTLYHFIFQQFL